MARTSLSGFPEWLPEGRIIEMHVLDELRRVFELHGFAGIETRAVETLARRRSTFWIASRPSRPPLPGRVRLRTRAWACTLT